MKRSLMYDKSDVQLEDQAFTTITKTDRKLRSFLGMPLFASVAPLAAANLTDLTVGEQAKRVMQRFYAEHNEQTRRLFDELAPGAAEGVSWLRGATASTAPKSRERSRHRHL